ncbi:MAG: response regulator transcription factor [Chromatiales bacterium]|jgi:DNA-binding NarL/FixJ family response regulator
MALTILLCDDHTLFREGLTSLLQKQPGWQVVAETADGNEAVRLAGELKPDLAIIDVAMPQVNGIDTAAAIRDVAPKTRILALSMYSDPHYQRRMLAAGAAGYVLKNEAGADLVKAIMTVLRGETFVSPALQASQLSESGPAVDRPRAKLTSREREVLSLLAQGQRTREIAELLGISARTVETYRSRLMMKLGIDNLAGLIKFAIRAGIVSAEH